jgi:hypothetical protein
MKKGASLYNFRLRCQLDGGRRGVSLRNAEGNRHCVYDFRLVLYATSGN